MFCNPCRRAAPAVLLALAATVATAGPPTQDPHAGTLEADRLVEDVLAANPGLAGLEAAVREAGSRIGPAGSLDDPRLTYETAPESFGSRIGDRHAVGFSQPIPWPGKLALRSDAAGYRADAAEQRLAAARLEVEALTRTAHAEWHFVHRALEINAASQALLEDLKDSAEALYAAGRGHQQDVLRAERERTHLLHQEAVHERERVTIRAQINALLGRPPERPLPPPGGLAEPEELPPAGHLRMAAAQRHPELGGLRDRVAAGEAEVDLARKDFYPDFELMTGYNNMWDQRDMRWTVGIGISVPLDRGKRRAELDAAKAARQRAEWALADRRTGLLAELESAHAKAAESQHIIHLYESRLVPLARETLDASLAAYRSGGGDFLSVIEAEKEALRAELELARARADYVRRLAELKRWAGGELPAVAGDTAATPIQPNDGDHHE